MRASDETLIEAALTGSVKALGGKSIKLTPWGTGIKGIPDRLILLPHGRVWFIETKRPKGGRFETKQQHCAAMLIALGMNYAVLRTREAVTQWALVRKAEIDING